MIGLLGSLTEAWGEVRVHKARVLLSLVGVFLAVLAMTTVTALGAIAAQVQQEQAESNGRTATIGVQAYDPMTGSMPADEWQTAVEALIDRYGLPREAVATVRYSDGLFRLPGGTQTIQVTRVTPSYGPLHRVAPIDGRWLREGDRQSMSPALVVNEYFLGQLGVSDLSSHPTVVIGGPHPQLATIVGVVGGGGDYPLVYRIDGSAGDLADPGGTTASAMYGPPNLELWVPSDQADAVIDAVQSDLALLLPGAQVQAYRQDPENLEGTIAKLRLAIRGAGLLVLALGGVGVLNIGLVTVRQRIREIGVRRSFGATSARVFSAVMLESVVATALAGLAAVALSVAIVRNLPLERWLGGGIPLADAPGFPVSAAIEGLIAATAVGALAGLVPALIAVRVKVIDAIRF
jgi:putative ABC transport system permease protein